MATPMNPILPDPACLHLAHLEASPHLIIAHVSTLSPAGTVSLVSVLILSPNTNHMLNPLTIHAHF